MTVAPRSITSPSVFPSRGTGACVSGSATMSPVMVSIGTPCRVSRRARSDGLSASQSSWRTQSATGVILEPAGGRGDTFESLTTTRAKYRTVYLAGDLTWPPAIGDVVTFPDGTHGAIEGVSVTNVDGLQPVLYEVTVRK